MTIYKLTNSNGTTESQDLGFIQELRATYGGTIEVIVRTFKITNDPLNVVYELPDDRDVAMGILREDTYQGFEVSELLDPQPEGLND